MRSLWQSRTYIKNPDSLLNWIFVCWGGLDLSKKVLWVSVGQSAADQWAVKVGGQKKKYADLFGTGEAGSNWVDRQNFFWPPTLTARKTAALWLTETHSTSLERFKPSLLTQALSKSLEALLMYSISVQNTLISIVFISKGTVFVASICITSVKLIINNPMCCYSRLQNNHNLSSCKTCIFIKGF